MPDLSESIEVHLRWFDLDAWSSWVPDLERTLAADERQRANRFATPLLRDRFIAGRGLLRRLLASRTGTAPDALTIEYGPHGKPRLAAHEPHIEFSVSHSGPTALIGVSTVTLGVDVERSALVKDVESVAAQVFSAEEMSALAKAADKSAAFLRGWTRKEAVLKARGTGLSSDARTFSVSLGDSVTLRLEGLVETGEADWTLLDLSRLDHVAAVAVRTPRVSLVVEVDAGPAAEGGL